MGESAARSQLARPTAGLWCILFSSFARRRMDLTYAANSVQGMWLRNVKSLAWLFLPAARSIAAGCSQKTIESRSGKPWISNQFDTFSAGSRGQLPS